MKAIVSFILITLLCGISLTCVNADRICASRKKNAENLSLKQNSAIVPEDVFIDHNVSHIIVNFYKNEFIFFINIATIFILKLYKIYSMHKTFISVVNNINSYLTAYIKIKAIS